jgi:signal transduction histidine kinase
MLTDDQLLRELERRFKENKESLDTLQKMTHQLKEVNKKLEESEALKTHFISNITNEIINPFAAILGLSRSILDVKKENWDRVISMVHLIHSEAFHLDFQLRNIFAAAKLEAGDWLPEIMNCDVNQLINNTLDSFKYEAAKRRIRTSYDFVVSPQIEKSFYFLTDPEKLKIMISNLLSNAVKYSHSESEVVVRAWLEAGTLCVSVTDNGIGVSESNRKIIFDRFKRVDNGINSINRGHGLGLSVNKAIIDLLQGSITMESKPNVETIFTIRIPPGETTPSESLSSGDGSEFLFDSDSDEIF